MDESVLRGWSAGWPGVSDSVKWEDDLVFCVAEKMFCVLCLRGPQAGSLSFRVEDERFLELTERPGFIPAPYLARAHWVHVAEPGRLPPGELHSLLRRSYELVRARLPKKTQRELVD
ncbi:MmcQ/YjbR family DNA-binding protein [Lysobacter cavernae]|uniref:MmcQ/YjbR family DNA-binding protein n=1 Tax=Lysobacter cavernae TaxID=1685901 RepID=A0ABV7RR19_9GAMM